MEPRRRGLLRDGRRRGLWEPVPRCLGRVCPTARRAERKHSGWRLRRGCGGHGVEARGFAVLISAGGSVHSQWKEAQCLLSKGIASGGSSVEGTACALDPGRPPSAGPRAPRNGMASDPAQAPWGVRGLWVTRKRGRPYRAPPRTAGPDVSGRLVAGVAAVIGALFSRTSSVTEWPPMSSPQLCLVM